MANCLKMVLFPVSFCLVAAWAPSSASAQSELRDRLTAALETVEGACARDIENFCGKVTRGEGRLLSCMQAHDDQLSLRCQFAVYRASRKLEGAINRVGRIADACLSDIEAHCGDADRIGQCVVEKRASLSPSCQTVVGSVRQAVEGLASLIGLPVFSADDKNLGQVVEVTRGPDGKVQNVQVRVGQLLGLGDKVVTINAEKLEQLRDRVRLQLSADDIRSLPDAKAR
jgi:PRC-barrel domain/Cysteine rich repeat